MGLPLSTAKFAKVGPAIGPSSSRQLPQASNRRSRLHIAAEEGSAELVQLLLDTGADTSSTDFVLGQTPLHVAVTFEHVKVVEKLLNAGAPLDIPDWTYRSPIHQAVKAKNIQILRLLVNEFSRRSTINRSTLQGFGREHSGEDPFTRWLPQYHADGTVSYFNAGSALHDAAIHGIDDAILLLLSHQPDIYSLDLYGRTALDYIPDTNPALRNGMLDHWKQHPKPNRTEQQRTLHRTVKVLFNNLSLSPSHQSSPETDIHLYALGKSLLYLDNEQAAKTVFTLQGDPKDCENARYSTVNCRRCRKNPTVSGGRWVCKTCPDVDLCSRCARAYADYLIASPSCVAHQFLEIRPEDQIGLGRDGGWKWSATKDLLEGITITGISR
ncbi:ankyrin repeat-containing domain protein [Aspergillus karnatakaensis]|uniref:ankyrin repeat-containing domain protein n=1 Tax=Aspergillus karnatakaensis TaxID=1810916 RepID=UPI003CCDB611